MRPTRPPFPYFGGKARIASLVWQRFGHVNNYVEPFAGSLAVFLAAPYPLRTATLNDLDGMIVNFWRAVKADPAGVAAHADWPVTEVDLFARHVWLVSRREDLTEKLMADPDFYDAQAAGWWLWGISAWIGSGWVSGRGSWWVDDGRVVKRGKGKGVPRRLPHLGNRGKGIHRHSLLAPGMENSGLEALQAIRERIEAYMWDLAARLRVARITAGDFERVLTPSVTTLHGLTAVFLDPPYNSREHDRSMYVNYDSTASVRARRWAAEGRVRIYV